MLAVLFFPQTSPWLPDICHLAVSSHDLPSVHVHPGIFLLMKTPVDLHEGPNLKISRDFNYLLKHPVSKFLLIADKNFKRYLLRKKTKSIKGERVVMCVL